MKMSIKLLSKRIVILLLLCLVFSFVLCSISCRQEGSVIYNPKPVQKELEEFCEKMHLTFPPSTKLLNQKHLYGLDDFIFLKIQINKDELDTFIKSSPFANKKLYNDRRYLLNMREGFLGWGTVWFDPQKPKKYLSGRASLPNAEGLMILIDLDDPHIITIYLMWFET